MIVTIDSHTCGQPTRVVVGGIPYIPGKTMVEKKEYARENLDFIRTGLIQEPRGHKDMFGAIITPPTNDKADFGVIFMDCSEFRDMCLHGSIGVIISLVKSTSISLDEDPKEVVLDTPAGLVSGYIKAQDEVIESVTIRNVPSFLFKSTSVDLPGIGTIPVDIAFGGSFFAIVNAQDIGLRVEQEKSVELSKVGIMIRTAVNKQISVEHPTKKHINFVHSVRICDQPTHPDANAKNAVISRSGHIDRSPCGTGSCAYMATLYAKGQLGMDEEYVHESIIGTTFKGRLVRKTKVANYSALIPEITGNAYVTGMSTFIFDSRDPLRNGFMI